LRHRISRQAGRRTAPRHHATRSTKARRSRTAHCSRLLTLPIQRIFASFQLTDRDLRRIQSASFATIDPINPTHKRSKCSNRQPLQTFFGRPSVTALRTSKVLPPDDCPSATFPWHRASPPTSGRLGHGGDAWAIRLLPAPLSPHLRRGKRR
jgi:hypothetical protein